MYEKMYKCRMCGDTFTKDIITDELKTSSVLTDLCNRRDNGLHVIHYCSNGNIGIAELQGMKIETEI